MHYSLRLPSTKAVAYVFVSIVACLVALSTVGQLAKHLYGHTQIKGFVPAFYVDYESNIPTWYSSLGLGTAAILLGLIALFAFKSHLRDRWHWAGLAALFALLSADEISMLHEYPIEYLRNTLGAGGLLYYTWVLPGMAFVALVGLMLLGFLSRLPRPTAVLFLLGGAVFVSGAIGVEMVSGLQADRFGEETLGYALIVTLEETCEMLGVVIFIAALVQYMHRIFGPVGITFHAPAPANAAKPAALQRSDEKPGHMPFAAGA